MKVHSRFCWRFVGKMMIDSDFLVINGCTMMLKKSCPHILFMFYACTQIDVEVSLIKIDYWLINILCFIQL